MTPPDLPPDSDPPTKRESFLIIRLVLSLFLLTGAGILWALTLEPLVMAVVSVTWERTPCVVLASAVRATGEDSDCHHLAVTYRYAFHGEEYTSTRFAFGNLDTSVYDWKRQAAGDYPLGRETECFVNPGNPSSAVIERQPHPDAWLGLAGLPFFLVGCCAFLKRDGRSRMTARRGGSAKVVARQRKSGAKAPPVTPTGPPAPPGWRALPPTEPRGRYFYVILAAALFWNGIVGTLLWQILHSTPLEWGPILFASVFVGGGVLLCWSAIYTFLSRFNPTLRVLVQDSNLRLGGSLGVEWEFQGDTRRIRTFTVTLEGAEVATYSRGTNTITQRRVFAKEELYSNTDPLSMARGEARLHVPADSMHTFLGTHNSIVWQLRLHGEIPRFPNVNDVFPIQVGPLHFLRAS